MAITGISNEELISNHVSWGTVFQVINPPITKMTHTTQTLPMNHSTGTEVFMFRVHKDDTLIVNLNTHRYYIVDSLLVEYVLEDGNWDVGRDWSLYEVELLTVDE